MRVLFTTIPSYGHFHPLVPLARALCDAGHEVTVATSESFADVVARSGLRAVPAGLSEERMVELAARCWSTGDVEPSTRGLRMFAQVAAPAMAADAAALLSELKVDLLVHEEGEWGGPVAAAAAGVPAISHGWGTPFWTSSELELIDSLVRPLWQKYDVVPASAAGLLDRSYLDICPPSLQAPSMAGLGARRQLRFESYESAGDGAPTLSCDPPAVYVTLGTVPTFNRAPQLLQAVVAALAHEVGTLVVTVGPGNDPAALGDVPDNVQVASYVPQSEVLPQCALAITHGGAGSTLGALAVGVPVLVLPQGAPSQRRMASACVAAEVGRALMPGDATRETIAAEALAILDEPRFTARAQAVHDDMQLLPAAADLVGAGLLSA